MRPRVFECPRAHPGAKIPSSRRLLFSPLVRQPMDGSARPVRARVANKPARFLDDAADDEPPPKRAKEGGNSEVRSPRDSGRDPTSTLRHFSRLSRLRVWGKNSEPRSATRRARLWLTAAAAPSRRDSLARDISRAGMMACSLPFLSCIHRTEQPLSPLFRGV